MTTIWVRGHSGLYERIKVACNEAKKLEIYVVLCYDKTTEHTCSHCQQTTMGDASHCWVCIYVLYVMLSSNVCCTGSWINYAINISPEALLTSLHAFVILDEQGIFESIPVPKCLPPHLCLLCILPHLVPTKMMTSHKGTHPTTIPVLWHHKRQPVHIIIQLV